MVSDDTIRLQLDPSPTNARNSEAAFVTLKSGRIVLAWSKFTGTDFSDFGAAVIATRYSDDGGLTWSDTDEILVEQEGTVNVMSPSLLRLQDGRIAVLYLRKDSGQRLCMPYIRFSDDELQSLSDPIGVSPVPGYYTVNNDRLVQLRGGRIIMPVSFCRWRAPSTLIEEDYLPGEKRARNAAQEPFFASPTIILFYFSDDGGDTWLESLTSYYHCFPTGHGIEEPGLLELKDGRLWSWARSGPLGLEGCGWNQWQSFSEDQGQVWSPPEPSPFVSCCSPLSAKRIPATGDLFAVWNDHSGRFKTPKPEPISWGRTPLVCAVSRDEGKTWGDFKLLESAADHGFCYVAIHFTDDAVLLSYNAGGATTNTPLDTQRVRRIPLDVLYGR